MHFICARIVPASVLLSAIAISHAQDGQPLRTISVVSDRPEGESYVRAERIPFTSDDLKGLRPCKAMPANSKDGNAHDKALAGTPEPASYFFNTQCFPSTDLEKVRAAGYVIKIGADEESHNLFGIPVAGSKKLLALEINADTLQISAPISFPQTQLTLHVRHLIFTGDGSISTSPIGNWDGISRAQAHWCDGPTDTPRDDAVHISSGKYKKIDRPDAQAGAKRTTTVVEMNDSYRVYACKKDKLDPTYNLRHSDAEAGEDGLPGGNITLDVQEISVVDGAPSLKRFLLAGGAGQTGGLGRAGYDGTNVGRLPVSYQHYLRDRGCWAARDPVVGHCCSNLWEGYGGGGCSEKDSIGWSPTNHLGSPLPAIGGIWYGDVGTRDWPSDGYPALADGSPGKGGLPGTLLVNGSVHTAINLEALTDVSLGAIGRIDNSPKAIAERKGGGTTQEGCTGSSKFSTIRDDNVRSSLSDVLTDEQKAGDINNGQLSIALFRKCTSDTGCPKLQKLAYKTDLVDASMADPGTPELLCVVRIQDTGGTFEGLGGKGQIIFHGIRAGQDSDPRSEWKKVETDSLAIYQRNAPYVKRVDDAAPTSALMQAVVMYARDLFLAGYREDTGKLVDTYLQWVASACAKQPCTDIASERSALETIQRRLIAGLDLFGRPSGYAPALALDKVWAQAGVAEERYNSFLTAGAGLQSLQCNDQNDANNKQKLIEQITRQRDEEIQKIGDDQAQLTGMQPKLLELDQEANRVKARLEAIKKEIEEQAAKDAAAEKRKHQNLRIVGGALAVVSVCVPVASVAAAAIAAASAAVTARMDNARDTDIWAGAAQAALQEAGKKGENRSGREIVRQELLTIATEYQKIRQDVSSGNSSKRVSELLSDNNAYRAALVDLDRLLNERLQMTAKVLTLTDDISDLSGRVNQRNVLIAELANAAAAKRSLASLQAYQTADATTQEAWIDLLHDTADLQAAASYAFVYDHPISQFNGYRRVRTAILRNAAEQCEGSTRREPMVAWRTFLELTKDLPSRQLLDLSRNFKPGLPLNPISLSHAVILGNDATSTGEDTGAADVSAELSVDLTPYVDRFEAYWQARARKGKLFAEKILAVTYDTESWKIPADGNVRILVMPSRLGKQHDSDGKLVEFQLCASAQQGCPDPDIDTIIDTSKQRTDQRDIPNPYAQLSCASRTQYSVDCSLAEKPMMPSAYSTLRVLVTANSPSVLRTFLDHAKLRVLLGAEPVPH